MIRKRSVTIRGHRTSISLEDEFWQALQTIAGARGVSLSALIAEIDENRRPDDNLSSSMRLCVLEWLRSGKGL
ncbi:ribbon-helix-helix domain-containing protein [Hoeflea poritis]|uniref:Ribbon-helix-helix domain-containing protein n=1 Tax=Hoeflea poritis TaxID=2993659 RepID=A0ABT4VQJ9_9HYPH|nr:ribbon-helix-helix domain-containing protein [Hoeflea poritis]MDA4846450.1 ribbon-helix-helix domain-containing protein [Hoeflea poritis]